MIARSERLDNCRSKNYNAELTLRRALARYLRDVTPHKKGAPQEINRIKKMMRHPIARRRFRAIRGAHFARYRDKRLAASKAASTVKNELAIFSHVYTIARQEWGMERLANPVAAVRKPRTPPGRDRRLVNDEERRLLHTAGYPMRELIVIAIETSMRLGELLNLCWRHVNLQRRVVLILDTKNGEPRKVPLSTRAYKTLKRMPRQLDGRLFPALSVSTYSHRFKQLCAGAGIAGLRFHDLRHEAVSRLFELGLNVMEVAAISGHKSLSMLQRYTHPRVDDLVRKLA